MPGYASRLDDAQRFVREKWDWIQIQLEALPPPQPFVDGGTVLFHGEPYTLICPGSRGRPFVDHMDKTLNVPALPDTLAGRTRRFLIREAREALTQCTRVHAGNLDQSIAKISVRDTSSRWGSCKKGRKGAGGEISYSWRLICAPPFVLDYVVAHECAHLVHADHSKRYWALLDTMVDTVKPAKKWLNTHGALLHAVGAEY